MTDRFKVGERLFCVGANEHAETVRPTRNRWCTITGPLQCRGKAWPQYSAKFDSGSMLVGEFELRRFDPRKLLVL